MSKKVSGWPLIAPRGIPEGGGAVFVPITMNEAGNTYTAEGSYDDVVQSISSGKMVVFIDSGDRGTTLGIATDYAVRSSQYLVNVLFSMGDLQFTAASSTVPLTATIPG